MFETHDSGMQARSEIRRLLADHDHRPRKSYGQNFLANPEIIERIVDVAQVDSTTNVVEIGAGTGALTIALAAAAKRVVAYEVDHALEGILNEALSDLQNVELRFADVTRIRLAEALGAGPWTMVSNLPYNVGTGIVLDALQQAPNLMRMVVMVQAEVADRMLAPPGSKTYGIPSVIVGLHGNARLAFSVPPHMFEPVPRVDSSVVVIDRVDPPAHAARAIEIASAAFGQRRKMLRRSLVGVLVSDDAIESAGIDPTARPETLSPEDFVRLAVAESAS
jgi:16S rRNA (adenine1518-N6/adenine1519-N6)-dimethyltransferase